MHAFLSLTRLPNSSFVQKWLAPSLLVVSHRETLGFTPIEKNWRNVLGDSFLTFIFRLSSLQNAKGNDKHNFDDFVIK